MSEHKMNIHEMTVTLLGRLADKPLGNFTSSAEDEGKTGVDEALFCSKR